MREFLGDYSFDRSLSRLRELATKDTLVIVPTDELKSRLGGLLPCPVVKVYEAAITFLDGQYPRPILRELYCLRVVRSTEGGELVQKIFQHRKAGVGEARVLSRFFDELYQLGSSAKEISRELKLRIHPDEELWRNLSLLEELYLSSLSYEGFNIYNFSRVRPVILLGILEIPKLLKLAISKSSVKALIFDTAESSGQFNEFGEITTFDKVITLPETKYVASPRDYYSQTEELLRQKEVVCLLFDKAEEAVTIQRAKEIGITLEKFTRKQSHCVSDFLNGVLKAFTSKRLTDLFSLLRNTAIEDYLSRVLPDIPEEGILAVVDSYQESRLQLYYNKGKLIAGRYDKLVTQIVSSLVEEFITPLNSITTLKEALSFVGSKVERFFPEQIELVRELSKFESEISSEKLSVEDSLRLTIGLIGCTQVPIEGNGSARIYDSLQSAYFTNQTSLVLLGPIKGRLPSERYTSIFLNKGIKNVIGLNERNELVDRYLLSRLAPRIKLIVVARKTLTGAPTAISPALYPEGITEIANEVIRFYKETPEVKSDLFSKSQVINPLPKLDLTPLRNKEGIIQLSVTALESYMNAPFRFYIERILKAVSLTDEKIELAANQFGELAHQVLRVVSSFTESISKEEISLRIEQELGRVIDQLYGDNISAVAKIQLFNLKERLLTYAEYEAQFLKDGWRTIFYEKNSTPLTLNLHKERILLTGRVDRIDFNRRENSYRIWDYKTSDTPKSVFSNGAIKSIQLPLYAYLLKNGYLGEYTEGSTISVGYIGLGSTIKKPSSEFIKNEHLEEVLSIASVLGNKLIEGDFEVGQREKINLRSDYTVFADAREIDFDEGEFLIE